MARQRFSGLSLLWNSLGKHRGWREQWRRAEPKAEYDAVVIGGGGHGLGTAYYLAAEHGLTRIAVLEKGWIGGGNTGRNTTIIRSNYLFDESARLYDHSVKMWEDLSQVLNYNVMFSPRGVMMLAHTVHDVQVAQRHIHANRCNGVDNEWLTPEEAKAYCPPLNIDPGLRYPVLGAALQVAHAHGTLAVGTGGGHPGPRAARRQAIFKDGLPTVDGRYNAALFGVPLARFYPHLALGIIFWNFLSTSINDGCQVFINAASYLKQGAVPRSVFVWRSLARHLFFLAHHLVLYVPVAIWAGLTWSPQMLLVVPGLLVVVVNLHALSITLGLLSARFRDVPNIVASSLQLLMFLTPVFWFPEKLPERSRFILYNPLAQLLDVLRLPLLGGYPAPGTIRFLLYFTALNVAVAALLYARLRRQVVYWV